MISFSRRQFLWSSAAAGAVALAGCATPGDRLARAPGFPPEPWAWGIAEQRLMAAPAERFELVVRGSPQAAVLRKMARPVPLGLDLTAVEARMRRTMKEAKGVGLAGPQVGLSLRIATLMSGYRGDHPQVIFVRNPVIVARSDQSVESYEGCLSIPGVGGLVRRSRWVKIQHTTLDGEILTQEAKGPDAILWQHELDHLDGVLYIDRLQGPLLPMEEVRRRRELQSKGTERPVRGAGLLASGRAEHRSMLLL